ncbi:hypothetical protein K457DRAFT_143565, partial [Linnemannia elongata AG-77]
RGRCNRLYNISSVTTSTTRPPNHPTTSNHINHTTPISAPTIPYNYKYPNPL